MSARYPRFVLRHYPSGARCRTVPASTTETLYQALERAGVEIRTRCRGSTICGQCWVHVLDDADALPPMLADERQLLDRSIPGVPDTRLACRIRLPRGVDALDVATPYWKPAESE